MQNFSSDFKYYQHTIKEEVLISGAGIHSGQSVTMRLKPAEPNTGIVFQRIDLPGKPLVKADVDNVIETNRSTTIEVNGARISTIEHILAALVGTQIDNILIEIDDEEVPILDGSAQPFVEALRREFIYAFNENKYPGLPELHVNTISSEPFVVGDIPVIPIVVHHLNMPVLGFRFGKFTYITDANRIDEKERIKITGSEVIVLNALRKKKHLSHFTLDEAVALVHDLNIPSAYFTHMSHQIGRHDEINTQLPKGNQLAWDGLTLEI